MSISEEHPEWANRLSLSPPPPRVNNTYFQANQDVPLCSNIQHLHLVPIELSRINSSLRHRSNLINRDNNYANAETFTYFTEFFSPFVHNSPLHMYVPPQRRENCSRYLYRYDYESASYTPYERSTREYRYKRYRPRPQAAITQWLCPMAYFKLYNEQSAQRWRLYDLLSYYTFSYSTL